MSNRYRRTPMHDRGKLFFSLLVLAFITWGQTLVKQNTAEPRIEERRKLAPVWHQEAPGGLRTLAAVRDGESTVAVAQWETALRVLGPDGAVRAERELPAGALVAVADVDRDEATQEILVASEAPGGGAVSVQVLDRSLVPQRTAGPASALGAPVNLTALQLDGEYGLEVAVGDARGCVAALGYPGQLWSDCPGGLTGLATGELQFLAGMRQRALDHPGDNLLAAGGNGRVRVYGPEGQVVWTREIGGGLHRLLVSDLYQDGVSEVIFATPGGRLGILDGEGGEDINLELGDPLQSLALVEWGGQDELVPQKLLFGGSDGKVYLYSFDGMKRDEWSPYPGRVEALLGADLDGDRLGDLISGLGSSRVQVFEGDYGYLTVRTSGVPRHLAVLGGRLLVGADGRVQAYEIVERGWQERFRPLLSPILLTLAFLLAGAPVIRLHPLREDWKGVDWPRERLPPKYLEKERRWRS
jgi:hypothetical protein